MDKKLILVEDLIKSLNFFHLITGNDIKEMYKNRKVAGHKITENDKEIFCHYSGKKLGYRKDNSLYNMNNKKLTIKYHELLYVLDFSNSITISIFEGPKAKTDNNYIDSFRPKNLHHSQAKSAQQPSITSNSQELNIVFNNIKKAISRWWKGL